MEPTRKTRVAQAIGVLGTLIVLARDASGAPAALGASGRDGASLAEGRSPVCGGPAISSAPAMVPCDSGGDGATSCETKQTVSVGGFGYVSGCGISCNDGWYACCQDATVTTRSQCSCQPNPPRGPWTPEAAW